jgi:hypothetical protein
VVRREIKKRLSGGMAYTAVSKTAPGNGLWVQVPPKLQLSGPLPQLVEGTSSNLANVSVRIRGGPQTINSKAGMSIKWADDADEGNYTGAESYLSLTLELNEAKAIVAKLRKSELTKFKAKDIRRASGLKLLDADNDHVKKDLKRIKEEAKELTAILLVRDRENGKVIVADGYHRLSAVYIYDEDAWIPCKIV